MITFFSLLGAVLCIPWFCGWEHEVARNEMQEVSTEPSSFVGTQGWKWCGGEWIHVYVASSCCPPETVTALLIGYTPIQNKRKKKEGLGSKYFRLGQP